MKTHKHTYSLILLIAGLAFGANAHASPDEWERPERKDNMREYGPPQRNEGKERPNDAQLEEGHKLEMLERFLDMPPERLAQIRETIERVESMSDEEKERMRDQIAEYREMHQNKRRKLLEAFERVPKEEREEMRDYWNSLSPEERKEQRQKLREMSPEERKEWRKNLKP